MDSVLPKPDPNDPYSFNHRYVNVSSGHRYHLIDQPPFKASGSVKNAPTLLLIHGFPDFWFGYRYQIHEFAARGWRVLCPTQLGYGESSQPTEVAPYSTKALSADMNSLLDECGVEGKVVVIGHDHGGNLAWRFVEWFPQRTLAVAVVCTPYAVPANKSTPILTNDELEKKVPHWGYQLYFHQPECAGEINQVMDLFLQRMHDEEFKRNLPPVDTSKIPSWVFKGKWQAAIRRQIAARNAGKLHHALPAKDLDYYLKNFRIGGIQGGLNWYRARETSAKEEAAAGLGPFPNVPAFMIAAELDAALPPVMATTPEILKCFPNGNLEVKVLAGGDHWCLQDEKVRDEVTEKLGDWIETVLAGKWKPAGKVLSKL